MAIIRISEPLTKKSIWISCLSELIGTFLLTVLGVGIIYINFSHPDVNAQPFSARMIMAAAGFGIVVSGLVFALGFGFPHGSAHLNPAFTLGTLILDKVTVVRALLFIISQCLGGLAAGGFLYTCFYKLYPKDGHPVFACTTISPTIDPLQGFCFEFIGTFTLVFGALACIAVCERHNYGAAVVATCLCVIIAIIVVVIGPYTGASVNPARSVGPAAFFGGKCWQNHWIYWAGPLTGGLLGGALVRILLYNEEEPQRRGEVVELHESRKLVVTTNA